MGSQESSEAFAPLQRTWGQELRAAEAALRVIAAGRSVLWLVPEAAQVAIAADMLAAIGGDAALVLEFYSDGVLAQDVAANLRK